MKARPNIPLEYARRLLSERNDELLNRTSPQALSASTGITVQQADQEIRIERAKRGMA